MNLLLSATLIAHLATATPAPPTTIPGLYSWRESPEAFVSAGALRWPDRAFPANFADPESTGRTPTRTAYSLDNLPSVQFRSTGTAQGLAAGDVTPLFTASAGTLVTAFRIPYLSNALGTVFGAANLDSPAITHYFDLNLSQINGQITFSLNPDNVSATRSLTAPIRIGAFYVATCRFGTALDTVLRLNRVQVTNGLPYTDAGVAALFADAIANAHFFLGSGGTDIADALDRPSDCNLLGLAIYSRELANAECDTVERYFATRFRGCQAEALPNAPITLALAAEDGTTTTLTWSDQAPQNETAVELWREDYSDAFITIGTPFRLLATLNAYTATYLDSTPDNLGAYYKYKVRARNTLGPGPFTAALSISPL